MHMNPTPRILVTNDDGIYAPGIAALIQVAKEFGEAIVVAPDSPQSGMGHAISVGRPLRINKEMIPADVEAYSVSGTPADCVKLATGVLMEEDPDLIVSGINHGYNSSVSCIYSGTLSAAREGAIQGIPSVGFSLGNFQHSADMSAAKYAVRAVIKRVIEQELRPGQLLNVNIPYLPIDEMKGIKVVRQAIGRWQEEFDERVDPYGRKYYWLTGNFTLQDEGTDTDIHVLNDGYVSVTPMTHDLTQYQELAPLTQWHFEIEK